MAVNPFFNDSYESTEDQDLMEDLIIEAIQIWGRDMYYVPRELVNFDKLLGEDKLSHFGQAFLLEMYLKTVEGFGGQQEFLSKFGIEVQDDAKLTVSRKRFREEVIDNYTEQTLIRPREGDLVYITLDNDTAIFEIKYVEDAEAFHQIGKLYTYELTVKRWEAGTETFDTGIPALDDAYNRFAERDLEILLGTGTGNFTPGEIVSQPDSDWEAEVINWNSTDKLLLVTKVSGEYEEKSAIVGGTSGANWQAPLDDFSEGGKGKQQITIVDGPTFIEEDVRNDIIDTTERNAYSR